MHIHILQHAAHEGPAALATWAAERNFSISTSLLGSGTALPATDKFDWLVVLGGPMSVHDDLLYPGLIAEKNLIRLAMQEQKVVIGICLGAQLIAHVTGAKVGPNAWPEIGFFPVRFNESAKNDPVFRFFPKQLTTFHWHGDIFDLPENAVIMAASEITPCQAFRLNNTVFGLQFHPECNGEAIAAMLEQGKAELKPSQYVQSEQEVLGLLHHTKLNNKILFEMLDKIATLKPGFLT